MGRFDTVILASDNSGKLAELGALLTPLGIKLIAQGQLGITSAEEVAITFVENALLKARHASRLAKLPAIADDSGIVVTALSGAPGVHSARYAGGHGDDVANNRKLLEALGDRRDRAAHFYCALVLVRSATDPAPIVATGAWFGAIGHAPRGTGGFGYDPLFIPYDGDGELTSAQLSKDEKNRISHRGQACAALRDQMGDQMRAALRV